MQINNSVPKFSGAINLDSGNLIVTEKLSAKRAATSTNVGPSGKPKPVVSELSPKLSNSQSETKSNVQSIALRAVAGLGLGVLTAAVVVGPMFLIPLASTIPGSWIITIPAYLALEHTYFSFMGPVWHRILYGSKANV